MSVMRSQTILGTPKISANNLTPKQRAHLNQQTILHPRDGQYFNEKMTPVKQFVLWAA